jgi:hypothetical protein
MLPVVRTTAKTRAIVAMKAAAKPIAIAPSAERTPFQNGTATRSRPSARVKTAGRLVL